MKLLSKSDIQSSVKKDNEELLETNLRLRKGLIGVIKNINTARTDYSSDKVRALKDFDKFVEELNQKKSNLLKELRDLTEVVEKKKDIYYGLIEKQDILEEKLYQMSERESKLDLRESFIKELEKKHGLL